MGTFLLNDTRHRHWIEDDRFTTCVSYNESTKFSYHGINLDEEAVSSVLPVVMLQVSLAFSISQILYILLRPLKQPKFVSNTLSGIILGPSFLGRIKMFDAYVTGGRGMVFAQAASTIGGIYFVFINTVKMDKGMIPRTIKKTYSVSLTVFIVPLLISLLVGHREQYKIPRIHDQGISISFVASKCAYPVLVDAISELKLLNSELGQLAISSALLHEIVGLLRLLMAPLSKAKYRSVAIRIELSLCAMSLFTFLVLWPTIQWIIRRIPERKPVKDFYIVAILTGALVMAVACDSMRVNYTIGAAMLGIVIPAGPPLGSALVEKSEAILSNFFLPFFYIHVGQQIDIYSINNWRAFAALELIIMAAYIGKVVASILATTCFRTSFRNALLFSCFVNIKGVSELVTFLRWRQRELIDVQTYSVLVLTNLAVTAIVTPLISVYYNPQRRLESIAMGTLQTALPDSELRILCGIHDEDHISGIVHLIKASNPTEMNPICAYVVHLVELVGRAAPVVETYSTQKTKAMANSTDHIMRAVIKYAEGSNDAVTIQPFIMISPYETMHESICKLVKDNCITLILLQFIPPNEETEGRAACLHGLNNNVLGYAPCTVGIFVDKRLNNYSNSAKPANFCYNVAVFFIGGPDDREAMALVSHMSSNPGVRITLSRIYLEENLVEDEDDKCLDEVVMNDFMASNFGNPNVVCRRIDANDSKQLVNAFRSLVSDNDLVIVGRQQPFSSRLQEETKPWVEYDELGIIGDMLASADFAEGMVSVLVIQSVRILKKDPKTVKALSNSSSNKAPKTVKALSNSSSNCDIDIRTLGKGEVEASDLRTLKMYKLNP
ncbi:Cation/H(+) antiporter 15 [Citrus sinensis]|uniref:cation/H(+) antiporter 15 n=1 Tax=Citrus clementina TaxID=85681 RepID=UPI0003D77A4C|nr:cation/H(+) antiporter 15 [Citrus x clementina]XP_024956580.1 cation/H(+) antiporter 15-like [Citrus sinensis]KAH9702696.1 Cation/H(+) antiporter 15 [Citrus sinensis]GAY40512.1 hypothetical protein CUMW_052480 [Citrus unshiu]